MYSSSGSLRYFTDPYKLIVEVDPELTKYYKSFIPKWLSVNQQRYPAHISIVRKEIPVRTEFWGKHEGQEIEFKYSNVIQVGRVYVWLNVFSEQVTAIRTELGLPPTSATSRPPDGEPCFHITLANMKQSVG